MARGGALVTYTTAPDATGSALGFFEMTIAVTLLLLGAVGVPGKPLLSAVIILASFRYGLNGLYEPTASAGIQTASGIVWLPLGLEDAQHRTALPFGRRGEARRAFEGDLGEQVGPVETEAGVRKQL